MYRNNSFTNNSFTNILLEPEPTETINRDLVEKKIDFCKDCNDYCYYIFVECCSIFKNDF